MAFIPSYWRETPQRYRYEGNKCKHNKSKTDSGCCNNTDRLFFPPRRVCDPWCDCEMTPCTVATTGKVLTYTVIHIAPDEFADETPYIISICEMDDGARITAQLVDCPEEKLTLGMRIRIEFRKIQQDGEAGILMYGYKVVPA